MLISVYFFIILLPRYLCPVFLFIGTKWFWTVQIVLEGSKLFWPSSNCFGQVQIILVTFKWDFFWTKIYNADQSKMIWIRPKQIGKYSTKIIWTQRRTRHWKLFLIQILFLIGELFVHIFLQLFKAIHFIRALVNFTLLNNLQ